MNGLHFGELVQMSPEMAIETITVCFVHGDMRRVWETPRCFLEEEILRNTKKLFAYRSDDTELRKELARRDRIWKAYRLAAHVQQNIDVIHKAGDHVHEL